MIWNSLDEILPDPAVHERVLIYTQGVDFEGEQVFDVRTNDVIERFSEERADRAEVCIFATHWTDRPSF